VAIGMPAAGGRGPHAASRTGCNRPRSATGNTPRRNEAQQRCLSELQQRHSDQQSETAQWQSECQRLEAEATRREQDWLQQTAEREREHAADTRCNSAACPNSDSDIRNSRRKRRSGNRNANGWKPRQHAASRTGCSRLRSASGTRAAYEAQQRCLSELEQRHSEQQWKRSSGNRNANGWKPRSHGASRTAATDSRARAGTRRGARGATALPIGTRTATF